MLKSTYGSQSFFDVACSVFIIWFTAIITLHDMLSVILFVLVLSFAYRI